MDSKKEFEKKFCTRYRMPTGTFAVVGKVDDMDCPMEIDADKLWNWHISQMKELAEKIIGEDETVTPFETGGEKQHRNFFRHKQRKHAQTIIKSLEEGE